MTALIGWILGLAVGLVLPRVRTFVLGLFTAWMGVGAWLGVSMAMRSPVWSVAVFGVALAAAFTLLVVHVPRVPLFFFTTLSLALGLWPLLERSEGAGPIVLGLCAVVAGGGLIRPRVGLRLGCASLGARLCVGLHAPAWTFFVLFAGFFVANAFLTPREWKATPAFRVGRLLGAPALVLLGVLSVTLFAHDLPTPAGPAERTRLARLETVLPQGGYVWPSLSEAAFWEDMPLSSAWDTLNARYLSGFSRRSILRLPATNRLTGAFIANMSVVALRSVKAADELEALALAGQGIVAAVHDVLPLVRPGVTERQLAAALEAAALRHGCEGLSFPSVVASGFRAAEAHARPTDRALQAGELLVMDVGCNHQHYASDFTRTFPVSGSFSADQRALYTAVVDAQQAALKACKPGARLDGPGSLNTLAHEVLRARTGERGYDHLLGHPVGLFVHDVGGMFGPLAPDMVITLEPGLYRKGQLGIRVEDMYRVTSDGCALMTAGFPASADEVEAALKAAAARAN